MVSNWSQSVSYGIRSVLVCLVFCVLGAVAGAVRAHACYSIPGAGSVTYHSCVYDQGCEDLYCCYFECSGIPQCGIGANGGEACYYGPGCNFCCIQCTAPSISASDSILKNGGN